MISLSLKQRTLVACLPTIIESKTSKSYFRSLYFGAIALLQPLFINDSGAEFYAD